MKGKVRIIILIFLNAGFLNISHSQVIVPLEIIGSQSPLKDSAIHLLQNIKNKRLLPEYEKEISAALSYFPELENIPVKFRAKKSFSTLKTRPSFPGMLMPKGHRSYVIVISNRTIQKLEPLLFQNLPEDARVGVIGHEMSHVLDFSKKTMWQSFKICIGHFSQHFMDSLEYHTDKICIEHGLGKELETWSSYIRDTMHTTYWRGADFVNERDTHYERYMNPSTIEKYMEEERKLSGSTTAIAR
jgi:hypothetical protein